MWYIFRHGETFRNRNNIKQGHTKNSFLTLHGIIQAHMNGMKLKNIETNTDFHNFKYICTPLERTYHTCQLIMEALGIDDIFPIQDELIISRCRGILEEKQDDEIEKLFPIECKNIKSNPWDYQFDKYESYRSSYLRLAKFIEKYREEKNLIIVAHKGVNRNLMYLLQKSKDIKNLVNWVENLSNEEGNKLVIDLKNKVPNFDQNYFYSWDGIEYKKY